MAKVAAETKAVTKNLKTVQITPPPAKVNDDRIPKPSSLLRPINTKHMVLMGSGPTNPTQRVLEALAKPTVGLYSEELYQIMDEVKAGLKYLFQTSNAVTFTVTGSGNSGMDCVLGNLIEPKDVVLVCVNGSFGQRAVEMSTRYGADVRVLESKLGTALTYEQIRAHVEIHKPKILFVCHGDSSVGVLQRIDNLGELCRRYDCLLVVDAVSTLGAVDLYVDDWKIDACFAATQKVLGAPAGLAPVTLSTRALNAISKRKTPSNVYYYDARLLADFYKCTDNPRWPHHTISAHVLYAFRESLAEIVEQGLDVFKQRHADNAQRLQEGLQNIGLELFVREPAQRLPTITSIRIPHGVKMEPVMKYLMERHSLEISTGFGITKGIIFRIGTMNANASHQKVDFALRALYDALKQTANFVAPQTKVYY